MIQGFLFIYFYFRKCYTKWGGAYLLKWSPEKIALQKYYKVLHRSDRIYTTDIKVKTILNQASTMLNNVFNTNMDQNVHGFLEILGLQNYHIIEVTNLKTISQTLIACRAM